MRSPASLSPFPSFLPPEVIQLTEETSIEMAQQIQRIALKTPLCDAPIGTCYTQQGHSNTPLLLLQGFDSSLLEFRRLLPYLAPQQETWTVDLLGFGFCDRPPELPIDTEALKIHLYHFWKTCIQRPMILGGASMGGAAALDFALTYPQAVEKLILLDSAGLAKRPIMGKFLFPPLDRWATDFLRSPKVRESISRKAYYDPRFVTPDANLCAALHLACPRWSEALISFTKSGGYGSFVKFLPQIQQQTLIIWGKNDKILGTKDASIFAQKLPHNQLVWIDQCGHVPHLEQPQTVAEEILNKISEF
ncbi:alpha/beta fold hydrolase [Spirulina subsalsa]|uniref:alpha/beta fold hydrolase n=1 Tax=Spirulina subsalsa TaxID=54311 RepID=UPI00031B766C|nr:alpha/beta hydrolase [Spirulina subsalsa]